MMSTHCVFQLTGAVTGRLQAYICIKNNSSANADVNASSTFRASDYFGEKESQNGPNPNPTVTRLTSGILG